MASASCFSSSGFTIIMSHSQQRGQTDVKNPGETVHRYQSILLHLFHLRNAPRPQFLGRLFGPEYFFAFWCTSSWLGICTRSETGAQIMSTKYYGATLSLTQIGLSLKSNLANLASDAPGYHIISLVRPGGGGFIPQLLMQRLQNEQYSNNEMIVIVFIVVMIKMIDDNKDDNNKDINNIR